MRAVRRDTHWWRSKNRMGLVAGSPGTFFRVTDKGAEILDDIENGRAVQDSPLLGRLIAAGAVHPEPGAPIPDGDVTVVIPAFARTAADVDRVCDLVSSLSPLQVVVVDDASPTPLNVDGAQVVRRDANGGPGAARNTGLEHVRTPYVAFIDDDISATAADIRHLSGHFADPNVSFVAPRVVTRAERSLIAEYESVGSRLDMGSRPARVRPGSIVPFVPSALLLARTSAMSQRFDDAMRFGEDVEFVWRTNDDAHQCRYEPDVAVEHHARRSWRAFIAQRFNYGRSAADIDARHPWSVAPVRGNVLHLLPLALLLAGQAFWAFDALLVSFAFTLFTIRKMGLTARDRLSVAWLSVTTASRHLATAVSREWWPLLLVLGQWFMHVEFAFWLAVAGLLLVDIYKLRPANIAMFVPMRLLDNFAYGIGVWVGAISRRSVRCLLPRVSVRLRRGG